MQICLFIYLEQSYRRINFLYNNAIITHWFELSKKLGLWQLRIQHHSIQRL